MRIQENSIILTKCIKMTEEVDRRHGMNGDSPAPLGVQGPPDSTGDFDQVGSPDKGPVERISQPTASGGGRLKFFKDGKFILELARAREGERVGWVSVPRKTFWPPPAPAPIQGPRQESLTSLSVSDDNSSVQSSPWQRDHCWKQAAPRHNISKEMELFYCRPANLRGSMIRGASSFKRRRPLDITEFKVMMESQATSIKIERSNGICIDSINGDMVDGYIGEIKKETDDIKPDKLKVTFGKIYRKSKIQKGYKKLVNLIQTLWEKTPSISVNNTVVIPSANVQKIMPNGSRSEHAIVSPRKRILREMEKVSLDDLSNKRSRAKCTSSNTAQHINFTPNTLPQPCSSQKYNCGSPSRVYNGQSPPVSVSRPVSSYSITSLLGKDESQEESPSRTKPVMKKSPQNSIVSHYHTETSSTPDLSPSPEHYRYRSIHNSPNHSRPLPSPNNISPPPEYRYKHNYLTHSSPNHGPIHNSPIYSRHSPQTQILPHQSPQYSSHLHSPSHYIHSPSPDQNKDRKHTKKNDLRYQNNELIDNHLLGSIDLDHSLIRPPIVSSLGPPLSYVSPYIFPGHYPPPYYGLPTAIGRYPNPLWMQYSLAGVVPRPNCYPTVPNPCLPQGLNWNSIPSRGPEDSIPKDDISSDVPLNLSKHGG